jgi:hypothetical protein
MAISDNTAVTKRIDVNRRLTYGELDTNFEQLSLVITDVGTLELQLGDKVTTLVYDNKISDIDDSILALENALIGTVSEEFVNQLSQRISVNEDKILTLINDADTSIDSTWSSFKIQSKLDTLITKTVAPALSTQSVTINEYDSIDVEISNFDTRLYYNVESLNEAIATFTRSGSTITITGENVTEDSTTTIRINAEGAGLPLSLWVDIETNIIYLPVVADDAIQVVDFSNESSTNDGWSQV